MEERSKTNKEIYEQKYPFGEVSRNPLLCAEAMGYLKALIQYFPSEKKWAVSKESELLMIMLFFSAKWGTNMWQEFNTGISDNITEVLKIIDDALCYGFEFKVENHKIYFREVA